MMRPSLLAISIAACVATLPAMAHAEFFFEGLAKFKEPPRPVIVVVDQFGTPVGSGPAAVANAPAPRAIAPSATVAPSGVRSIKTCPGSAARPASSAGCSPRK